MTRNNDRLVVAGGKLVLDQGVLADNDLVIENGIVKEIVGRGEARHGAVIEANGNYVAPGFIDVHTHGSFGIDLVKATPDELAHMQRCLAETGVTGFLATVAGVRRDEISPVVQRLQEARKQPVSGAQILGVHLEGPYLNPARCGAIPAEVLEPFGPSIRDFLDSVERPATMTLAPEQEGAITLVDQLNRRGIVACGGHSEATFEQTVNAVAHGMKHVTHLFNAMSPPHHRSPNIATAALVLDELTLELIADGHHVAPPIVALVNKAKGTDGIILVTDATAAAGMPDGEYTLGEVKVTVRDGIARTSDGALAGSTLTLDRAVKNFREFTGAGICEAVKTVTSNPARLLGIEDKKGKIEPNMHGDITIFDDDLKIIATIVAGKCVWKKPFMKNRSAT
ncbi:MAG: N-acetylglucosamine-6-phosphate deacetylase [Candidatus Hydrogenedentes bacterium]|nr:N-acetylglucosamine-6-phosphate deacetylase [Candidatus Hydrogenedentota bacterium]